MTTRADRLIGILHYTERGTGHMDVDPQFAAWADAQSAQFLSEMLEIEAARSVQTTYAVVGSMWREVHREIQERGHCLAFHSFDHQMSGDQLARCRALDAGVSGYSPPRSMLTAELEPARLERQGFRWLASARDSLGGIEIPVAAGQVTLIPILCDDFRLQSKGLDFDVWKRQVVSRVSSEDFAVIGLHDCYADRWLAGYDRLLSELEDLGHFVTLDEVADRTLAPTL